RLGYSLGRQRAGQIFGHAQLGECSTHYESCRPFSNVSTITVVFTRVSTGQLSAEHRQDIAT
ncbi:MAG: hypothetical protein OEZ14_11120, partial [Acidimicrobiia bacterium]|nr:hypothetical protein [Acidimicrobiia bacterium]